MVATNIKGNLPENETKKKSEGGLFSSLHLPVFISANIIILAIIAIAIFHPDAPDFFSGLLGWITENLGWYYLLAVGIILLAFIYVALSRFGTIKLGPDHSEPAYSDKSWFAMLFSTGMGIGIMFFGVAEPLLHYLLPPIGDGETIEAAKTAMNITFFHWGVHAWAIYGIVGLVLAYFSFRMNLPLALRSALYPMIGDRIYGRWGDAIDTFAVIGTVFGVATTLGFGVMQINTGLNVLFPSIPVASTTQVILIIVTTACATLSVSMGLDKGIKFLSELNLILAFALVLFVFLFGGKVLFLLEVLMQNIGNYFSSIFGITFNMFSYEAASSPALKESIDGWLGGWTISYWGWWIAWSPFVGMFIAKISRGRTIRNFVGGVLLIPAGFTFFWMTVFGNSAIDMLENDHIMALKETLLGPDGSSKALFAFISHFPVSETVQNFIPAEWIRGAISFVSVVMVAVFFVTSADSGALVMDMLSSKKDVEVTPLWQRIFWGSITGVIAIVLLLNGGLGSLQAVSTTTAFPFSIVILISIYGLIKALRMDIGKIDIRSKANMYVQPSTVDSGGWQKRLRNVMVYPRRGNVIKFMEAVVIPAFEEVKAEFVKQGLTVNINTEQDDDITFEVDHGENANFIYRVKAKHYLKPSFTLIDEETDQEDQKYFRAEVYLDDGSKGYDIMGYTKDNVMNDIVDQYTSHHYFIQNFEMRSDYEVGSNPND
ncbi:choline transporter [Ignatzschineria ureiclastica]|uniref:Choline transporter n=1 Tax=Ignatzschineria ureiclastica TaxID=472582 RepID=A0A2U2AE26_9GAMM|nr:BCCT family transporter [Ignatzschineria ureiclastica]PWD80913.1 choline transporter [Ignatzschineria ureiclastica]GGZ93928.1 choline transporter [Ignatzschineria ureiclastica]